MARAREAEARARGIDPKQLQAAVQMAKRVWDPNSKNFAVARDALQHIPSPDREIGTEHLILNYGEGIIDDPASLPFLAEFGKNLSLFGHHAGSRDAVERAALVSSAALPPDRIRPGADHYLPRNVEAVRQSQQSTLEALEDEFRLEANPVVMWEAVAIATAFELPFPKWILEYLLRSARNLAEISNTAASGQPIGKESDRVGKAMGFGDTGRGYGSYFKSRSNAHTRRQYYIAVRDRIASGTKPYLACDEIAATNNVSPSTIARAYRAFRTLVEIPETPAGAVPG
jgi:hypothetical protein